MSIQTKLHTIAAVACIAVASACSKDPTKDNATTVQSTTAATMQTTSTAMPGSAMADPATHGSGHMEREHEGMDSMHDGGHMGPGHEMGREMGPR